MRLVGDLHIHSRHSMATSPKLRPEWLDRWARVKGLDLVGSGDCTHPAWLSELETKLKPAEDGLFVLRDSARAAFDSGEALAEGLPNAAPQAACEKSGDAAFDGYPRFVLSGELSTIYSREGKTRKVHHLVLLPGFEAARAFQDRLRRVGSIESDGRPILGIDSRDLFAMLLEADERSILVPAHIWTPWFSALGERSGFDSIEECYGELSARIGAVETGLSSNPPMNWALCALDRFAIISNSDAHSPDKLGREATIFDIDPSYTGLFNCLSGQTSGGMSGVSGTYEFFPQEGKYHYDGHRACGAALPPEESARRSGLCPVCGKAMTPGVMGRVAALADRPFDETESCPEVRAGTNRRPYQSLIPLNEILSELFGCGVGSKKVSAAYHALVAAAGSELGILAQLPISRIESLRVSGLSGELLALAIGRMRRGDVHITAGYDGEYGIIKVFAPGERIESAAFSLFPDQAAPMSRHEPSTQLRRKTPCRAAAPGARTAAKNPPSRHEPPSASDPEAIVLDPAQKEALEHGRGPALVLAGPGSGKTAVLALRAARLVREGLDPASILVLTFTNKAAESLRERLAFCLAAHEGKDRSAGDGGRAAAGLGESAASIRVLTFHAFCRELLRDNASAAGLSPNFAILKAEEGEAMLRDAAASAALGSRAIGRLGDYIEARKRFLLLPGELDPRLGSGAPCELGQFAAALGPPIYDERLDAAYAAYRAALKIGNKLDFEDLVAGSVRLLAARPDILQALQRTLGAILVDEYQDLNFAQYALLRVISPSGGADGRGIDLFVIGDPNQAIYGFRGSDRRFIERFQIDYPGAANYALRRSFRCPAPILGAAAGLLDADLFADEAEEGSVTLCRSEYPSDLSEAEGIAREIDRLVGGTRFFARDSGVANEQDCRLRSLGECAILLRSALLAPPMEKALADHGIPCRLVGDRSQEGYEPRSERVWIMTIHAAKGLEFDEVFVAGLEDGILPFTLYDERSEDKDAARGRIDEERRLLYVAMTRARRGLRLSWARKRVFRGRELELPPSRFLSDLENLVPFAQTKPRPARDPQMKLF